VKGGRLPRTLEAAFCGNSTSCFTRETPTNGPWIRVEAPPVVGSRSPLRSSDIPIHRRRGYRHAETDNVGNKVSTPQIQRDRWREAAKATRSSLPGPPSPSAIMGSFVALIDHLIVAQTQLISSYVHIGSSVARRFRSATPTATTLHPRPEDDQSASARAHSDPTPAVPTDLIEARAYEIFVRRGRSPGNPVDDWRRAEAELRGEMTG